MTARHGVNMGTRRTIGMPPVALGILLSSCALLPGSSSDASSGSDPLLFEGEEAVLARPRQLTFDGQNAEAYFAPDDGRLVFQATPDSLACDQIFTMRVDGTDKRRVSTGAGVTTCGYFLYPKGDSLLFSSTHLAGAGCPPRPDYSLGYVWPIHPGYDVFVAATDGSGLRRLTWTPGYDAEATMSRDGSRIVFTSVRDGDLEIYTMARNGTDVRRLTNEPGYDGGAFFSYDGTKIVYRAHHAETPLGLMDYRALLAENLVRPSRMEIWVMDADGSDKRQLTDNGAANFAPYFFPDGRRIVFASNMHDPRGRNFDIYAIDADGAHLTRLTTDPEFDAFPMFSSDGRLLVWASNRNAAEPGDTNIFVADWVGHIPPP
jgi:Tol biopolymer transport system component